MVVYTGTVKKGCGQEVSAGKTERPRQRGASRRQEENVQEYRLLSTSGLLGYGFPEASLAAGMKREPHMIGVDGGSTDPGPYYLGSGKCVNSRMSMKRDLKLMLHAARSQRIPLVIGSCGGAGGEPHLTVVADIVREIAREEGLHFKLAVIH